MLITCLSSSLKIHRLYLILQELFVPTSAVMDLVAVDGFEIGETQSHRKSACRIWNTLGQPFTITPRHANGMMAFHAILFLAHPFRPVIHKHSTPCISIHYHSLLYPSQWQLVSSETSSAAEVV
ncbi:hypothetical protein AVEN_123925-1 [Araneus ventricosus]|uniref:Uncharacterized protein n=1 Tax=Araneus ventricosus TaxID=182803 RepID=A0A4Y2Q5R0_ARAVE|nr:hypothetical protein AVEN_123925-1 [Araneus ventricosus]